MTTETNWLDYNDAADTSDRVAMDKETVKALAQQAAQQWPAYDARVVNPHLGDLAHDVCFAFCQQQNVPFYHFQEGTVGRVQFAAEDLLGVTEAQRKGY